MGRREYGSCRGRCQRCLEHCFLITNLIHALLGGDEFLTKIAEFSGHVVKLGEQCRRG